MELLIARLVNSNQYRGGYEVKIAFSSKCHFNQSLSRHRASTVSSLPHLENKLSERSVFNFGLVSRIERLYSFEKRRRAGVLYGTLTLWFEKMPWRLGYGESVDLLNETKLRQWLATAPPAFNQKPTDARNILIEKARAQRLTQPDVSNVVHVNFKTKKVI